MKLKFSLILSLFLLSNQLYSETNPVLQNEKQKQSYSMGVDIGKRMKSQSISLDTLAFILGLKDALSGDKLLMSDQEMKASLLALQKELKEKQSERSRLIGGQNLKEGEAFLAENQKKEGVVTLASGLQYKVIKDGNGKIPKLDDTVVCHYKGTLIDGTEFDGSYKAGKPATFPVKGVIPGWIEVLQLMKEGSKWEVYIPAHLAYGDVGAADIIGPHATLIFEIELISIK